MKMKGEKEKADEDEKQSPTKWDLDTCNAAPA